MSSQLNIHDVTSITTCKQTLDGGNDVGMFKNITIQVIDDTGSVFDIVLFLAPNAEHISLPATGEDGIRCRSERVETTKPAENFDEVWI